MGATPVCTGENAKVATTSRRRLFRESKRRLSALLRHTWSGPRQALEVAVRRFLLGRPRSYLLRLVADGGFALAAATSLLAAGAAGALPPVELSDVAAGNGGFVMNGIDTYDQSGTSVSGAGDVNGDGVDDLIVGARYADPAGKSSAGESYVVFGRADGTKVSLADIAAGSGGFVINGIDPDDRSGRSVSGAGDVNGDGLADVIVGAPGADPGGRESAGRSYVVFGKADGTPVDLSDFLTGKAGGFVINGIEPGDQSGVSVSGAGDVNGDGLDDIIVGAFTADPGGRADAGECHVVFGKADGTAVDLSDITAGIGGFVINGIDPGDQGGFSVSGAGDVNGDGVPDLIVGARNADPGGNYSAGESYVVFGKFDGAAVELSAVAAGSGGFVINGIDPVDQSGYSVSGAGDVNGDLLADVIVGARNANPGGKNSAGQSYVVFGKADGKPVELSELTDGSGFVINGIDPVDQSGRSVSGAGDVNGDGLADVIVGAPSADPDGKDSAGECYVVFGKADGTAVSLAEVAAGNGGFVMNGIDADDHCGVSVSGAGDVNGDGLADVIVGAFEADAGGTLYAGETYVVFSPVVPGDLDGDGSIRLVDVTLLLNAWGPCPAACPPYCQGDLDGDCAVGIVDFLALLENWILIARGRPG